MATNSNLIQIKRSQTTGTPSALANGELAWSSASQTLFIGDYGSVKPIGGTRNPGVLTANQALVANSTSYIDVVKTANLVTTYLTANGVYNPGAGFLLATDGSGKIFWEDPTSFSVGTQYVQNTDSRVLSGNLTFTGSTTLFSGANVNFTGANTQINGLNVTRINRDPTVTLTGAVTGSGTLYNLGNVSISTTYSSINLSTDTSGDYVADVYAGQGISSFTGTGHGSTPTITVQAANGISVDASGVNVKSTTTGGIQVTSSGVSVKTSNGIYSDASGLQVQGYNGISVTSSGVAVNAANGISVTPAGINVQASNGIAVSSSGVYVVPGTGVHVDSSGVYIGQAVETTSDVTFRNTTLNGNVTLGATSSQIVTLNGLVGSSIIPSANVTYDLGSANMAWRDLYLSGSSFHLGSATISSSSGNTINVGALIANASITANSGVIYHNLSVGGDLYVVGNVVSSNILSISVSDPLLHLGANNQSDTLDLGFYSSYNVGSTPKYAGLVRDSSDKVFKLFTELTTDPSGAGPINFDNSTEATLKAFLISGGFVSNGSVINITANSTVSSALVANTLTLTTALGYASGGTGSNTYNNGDLLVGSSTTGLNKLSSGTTGGYLLQTDGAGVLYWGSLDGGTF